MESFKISENISSDTPALEKLAAEVSVSFEKLAAMDIDTIIRNLKYDGESISLFGEDIGYWFEQIEFSEEEQIAIASKEIEMMIEVQNQLAQYSLLGEVVEIWLGSAYKYSNDILFPSFRKKDDTINEKIKTVLSNYKSIGGFLGGEDGLFSEEIQKVFLKIYSTEYSTFLPEHMINEEDMQKYHGAKDGIIGLNDMQAVEGIFLDSELSIEQKRIQILNTMRFGGFNGNSSGAEKIATQHLLMSDNQFTDIPSIVKDISQQIIKNGDIGGDIISILGEDLAHEIGEKKETIREAVEAKKEEYEKILAYENEQKEKFGEPKLDIDEFLNQKVAETLVTIIKQKLVLQRISSMEFRGDETSYTGILANIHGLGKTKGYDWLTISDDNISTVVDISVAVGLGAVSMGVGVVSIGAVGIVARSGVIASRVANTGKIGQIGASAGRLGVEGLTFYESTNFLQNIMYYDVEKDFDKNWGAMLSHKAGDMSEIAKSVLFMGIIKGASSIPQLQSIKNLRDKVPASMLEAKSINTILQGASLPTLAGGIYLTDEMINKVTGGEWNPNLKEYFQFLILIAIFKGSIDKIHSK